MVATYSAAFLAARTRPIAQAHVCAEIGWVRAHSYDLLKAVIRTPMSGGKVDYESVPVGASIWVTVTDDSSPMHGRPILITKRPDGQFALDGGSGVSKWHDDPSRAKRIAARRHLVLGVGKVKPSRVDADVARRVRERDVKRGALAEKQRQVREARREAAKNTRVALGLPEDHTLAKPDKHKYQAQLVDLAKQAGADDTTAARYAATIVGELGQVKQRFVAAHALRRVERARAMIGGPLLTLGDPGVDPQAEAAANPAEGALATSPAASLNIDLSAMVQTLMAQAEANGKPLTQPEAEMAAQLEADRQLQAALAGPEPQQADPHAPPITPPDPAVVAASAAELQPHADPNAPPTGDVGGAPAPGDLGALAAFGQQAQELGHGAVPGDPLGLGHAPAPPPPVTLPLVELPEWTATQKEQAAAAIEAFRKEMEVRGAANVVRRDLQQYEGLRLITPAQVDRQMLEATGIADGDFDQLMDHYRQAHKIAPVHSFYEALTDHWNDALSYADGVGGYAVQGAIGAATGILGQGDILGERLDVAKLVNTLGIEGAAYALATDIIREHRRDPARIDAAINGLTEFNATNQQATEDRALKRHDELKRQQELIEGMLQRKELVGGLSRDVANKSSSALRAISAKASAEGTRLLCENLAAQRTNLGTALGSMQMAATLLHALESTRKMAGAQDPEAQFVTLYYGDNEDFRDEAMNNLTVGQGGLVPGRDPNLGHYIRVDTMRLGRYVNRVKAETTRNNEWQRQKESNQGVKEVDGQEVVPGYKVPFFKDSFTDADGETKPIVMRRNQRNDIEWLRKSGGGVITRTTGAGKTNTTLGFFAWKMHEQPDYHGVAVVPNGRGEQWLQEANNFTQMNVVHIPDTASAAEVEQAVRNYAHLDKGILVIGHRQAARHVHLLHALHQGGKLHGMAVDEPQEMQGQSISARLTAGAQQVLKVGERFEGNRRVQNPEFNRIALTATPAKRRPVQAYDLVNWTNPGALGPRTKFDAAYGGFAEGTSAADDALANMIGKEIGPFVSGDEEVSHPFQLNVREHRVLRTPHQVRRQREIEEGARGEMKRLSDQRFASLMARVASTKSEGELRAEANAWARERVAGQHKANLDSGQTDDGGRLVDPAHAAKHNAKIRAFIKEVQANPDHHKHVVFVDGPAQRAAVTQALRDAGYGPNAIKNIAERPNSTVTEQRKRAWKHGGRNVPFLLIDKDSASGHNLQEGDHLHILAAPGDAATLLQAQGRVARGNKRTTTTIHAYRTHDSPFETRDWEQIDRGMKLMAATSPGLAKKFLDRVTEAREHARRAQRRSEPAEEQMVAKSRVMLYLR